MLMTVADPDFIKAFAPQEPRSQTGRRWSRSGLDVGVLRVTSTGVSLQVGGVVGGGGTFVLRDQSAGPRQPREDDEDLSPRMDVGMQDSTQPMGFPTGRERKRNVSVTRPCVLRERS